MRPTFCHDYFFEALNPSSQSSCRVHPHHFFCHHIQASLYCGKILLCDLIVSFKGTLPSPQFEVYRLVYHQVGRSIRVEPLLRLVSEQPGSFTVPFEMSAKVESKHLKNFKNVEVVSQNGLFSTTELEQN